MESILNSFMTSNDASHHYESEYRISIARGSKKTLHTDFFLNLEDMILKRIIRQCLTEQPLDIHPAITLNEADMSTNQWFLNKAISFLVVKETYITTERTRQPIPITRIKEISANVITKIRREQEPEHAISLYPILIPETFVIGLSRLFRSGYLKTLGSIASLQTQFDIATEYKVPSIFRYTE